MVTCGSFTYWFRYVEQILTSTLVAVSLHNWSDPDLVNHSVMLALCSVINLNQYLHIFLMEYLVLPIYHCWRKICTLRQAHNKPNKLASHTSRFQGAPVNFPWKLTKDKVVRCQSLELAGWYQTVPYLRLKSHIRWHIAMGSYLPTN
jgi:hypothetical protein